MLDYMRKLYAGSNSTVALKKKINKLIDSKKASGLNTDSESLAKELGMSLEDFQKAQDKINNTTFVLNFSALGSQDSGISSNNTEDVIDRFVSPKTLSEDDNILVDEIWSILSERFSKRELEIMELIYKQE